MIKIKTIYDELKPEYKTELNANARKYSSAKRLKYTLMSKTIWQDLTMSEVSTMTTYCDVLTYKFSAQDILYGKAFLKLIMTKLETKNLAHDKAFAALYTLDTDISRLKQEIKDDNTPFITTDQLQGVLNHTEKQKAVWNYITKLIEIDHEKINYLT